MSQHHTMRSSRGRSLKGKDRLIVALDVSTHEEAIDLVNRLDNVSFFKVGLRLFMAGDVLGFIKRVQERRNNEGGVFIDLKISGDIDNTVKDFVKACSALDVKFITLVEAALTVITVNTIRAAKEARGTANYPRILMVPLFSSLDADDLIDRDVTGHILARGQAMLDQGCDGLIVSGDAIGPCRERFPDVDIVSPGIRPSWSPVDDHKRTSTPGAAIRSGADYLVVGRPIIDAESPRDAAARIIGEIDESLA